MKEKFQAEKEISIIEILKALLSKAIYLILAAVIAAGIGGVVGYYRTNKNNTTKFDTEVNFYINPIPAGGAASGESIYATYGSYSTNVMNNIVKLLETEAFAGQLVEDLMGGLDSEGKAIAPAVAGLPTEKYATGENEYKKTGLHKDYANWINYICDNVSFSFNENGSIAESFIKVKMTRTALQNTAEGREKAWNTLVAVQKQVKITVSEFVEQNMPKPSGYVATKCEPVDVIKYPDENGTPTASPTSTALKYAIIAGALAFIVAAAVVIAMHMSDKRLRDVDEVTKTFNVPVLGVIPSIEEKRMKHNDDKKGGKA